jgi:EAL domain-containing protein (putative c-di-GMP-specific phosphodiesterase class I)
MEHFPHAASRSGPGRPHSVVVIDDEPLARREIATLLHDSGVSRVLDTPFGHQALQWVMAGEASLVLCDLDMPAMDGVEFIERLAQASPNTPLVLMSATSEKLLRLAAEIAAAYGLQVVTTAAKPLRAADIDRILEHSVARPDCGPRPLAITGEEIARDVRLGRFEVFYQPLVRLVDARCYGAEALVRWQHPVHGQLSPGLFVPLAERCGQITELTRFVAARAIAQLGDWQSAGRVPGGTGLSLNVSPLDTGTAHFAELLEELVLAHNLRPDQITLELTETAVTNKTSVLQFVSRARLRGFQLALDDFGTGHSTLHNLRRIPLDLMKIDQSFVAAAVAEPEARSIVESSVKLGHQLGLRVLAEGVATAHHWALAEELGCDAAQGFWIAPPMPAAGFLNWSDQWRKRHGPR